MGNLQFIEVTPMPQFTVYDIRLKNKLISNSKSVTNKLVEEVKKDIVTSQPLELIKKKTSVMFDVKPRNDDIATYCTTLLQINFYGQCNSDKNFDKNRIKNLHLLDLFENFSLALFLKYMDMFLRAYGSADIRGDEEEFSYYLQGLLEQRCCVQDARKFISDAKQFLKIYAKRCAVSDELHHNEYWGTRQQLLAGKVIADFVDKDYGPLDPVFGVLLCPVAGRAGPGDSSFVHDILFDNTGPLAYHSAVHDAFGYLLTHHNIGPGYDYTGAGSIFDSSKCMSGQVSGIYFWKNLLKENTNKQANWI